jgi:hypothetical protein
MQALIASTFHVPCTPKWNWIPYPVAMQNVRKSCANRRQSGQHMLAARLTGRGVCTGFCNTVDEGHRELGMT